MTENQPEDEAIKAARMEERVNTLDRSVGHVVSTAQVGVSFVSLFVAILAIIVTIFGGIQVFMLAQSFEQQSKLAEQTNIIEKQSALIERQNKSIESIQSEISGLNRALGDTPENLRKAAGALDESQVRFRRLVSDLQTASADLLQIEPKITELHGTFVKLEQQAADVQFVLASPKGKLAEFQKQLEGFYSPGGLWFETMGDLKKDIAGIREGMDIKLKE